MLQTKLTDMLDIKYPIIQGAMGPLNMPSFPAAVSNAGGLGILAAVTLSPEGTRENIRKIRELTDKPFGVNMHPLAGQGERYEKILEVMAEEKVPVISHGLGKATKAIEKAKEAGSLAIPTIGSVEHARECERAGADMVIAQGYAGGGHASYVDTMVLVPSVIEAVEIPVIAAGGIATPEQFLAALAMGAEGISMGTRFQNTKEASIHPAFYKKIIESTEEDTVDTHHITGHHLRVVLNEFSEQYVGLPEGPDVKTEEIEIEDETSGWSSIPKAYWEGDVEEGFVCAGQAIGLIDDVPTVEELIERMVEGAEKALEKLEKRKA